MLGLVRRRVLTLGSEGHEGDIAGAFDRCAELALVSGTIAGDTARNDLATLGDQIAQSLDVLIIDVDDLICTEPAYFLARKAPFCRHDVYTSWLIRRAYGVVANDPTSLKGDVVIVASFTLRSVTRESPLACACRFRQELNPISQDFMLATLLSLLALPGAILQASFDEDGPAFVQVLTTALGLFAKDDDIDKAGVIAPLIPLFDAIIHCQPQPGNRCPRWCIPDFGVPSEVAQEYNAV
jgi:hypothetical protein